MTKFIQKKRKFIDSLKDAMNGIMYCLTNEKNMIKHFIVGILVLIVSAFFKVSGTELLIILLTIGCVIFAELVNTAIENTVDLITDEYKEKAKVAKDVAAGAVLLMAFTSVLVGVAIFYDDIYKLIMALIKG